MACSVAAAAAVDIYSEGRTSRTPDLLSRPPEQLSSTHSGDSDPQSSRTPNAGMTGLCRVRAAEAAEVDVGVDAGAIQPATTDAAAAGVVGAVAGTGAAHGVSVRRAAERRN